MNKSIKRHRYTSLPISLPISIACFFMSVACESPREDMEQLQSMSARPVTPVSSRGTHRLTQAMNEEAGGELSDAEGAPLEPCEERALAAFRECLSATSNEPQREDDAESGYELCEELAYTVFEECVEHGPATVD